MSEEQVGGLILPTNPEDRQTIKNAIKEISNSLTRKESETENIKSIVERIFKEFQIPKEAINKNAKWYHKQNKGVDVGKVEDAQDLYETLFGTDEE